MTPIIHFKTLLVFLLVPLFSFATVNDKHEKEKTIKRSFNVNANAELHIDNSYGNLNIITWNENKITIEVTIKTSGNNEEKVQKKLENITVDFESSNNRVSAKTIFNKLKSSWWNWGGNSNINMQVNYLVKMPITNAVNLSNDYGNINLDKLEGRAVINCDYGKITTKELLADNNSFNFDYTKGCYFDYIKSGSINADYSDFTISKVENITINADYTNTEIELAENVHYNCDYGTVKIDQVNNIEGNGDYLTVVVGDVYKNASIKADFGSIKIDNMTKNAGNITIESDYTGIKIGYEAGYNFNFDFDLSYASLSSDNALQFSLKDKDGSDKKYKGYYGSPNSGNSITIASDYGSVTLKRK
ncbi:hypothetical protein [Mangrovimonas cancribranchiae]|uniref:Adhesin domain-containing protein n=1 Tax=Mangrovimonas cancribranchiae TaxID=3080055 RepID=A0AAU6NZN3_9FLAO